MKLNVYAIEIYDCDGTAEVLYVAATDRQNAIETLIACGDEYNDDIESRLTWSDVYLLDGATYEADEPCRIEGRLCREDGQII